MKKILVFACIFIFLRMNGSALSFPQSVFSSSNLETERFQKISFSSSDKNEDEDTANDLFATFIALCVISVGVAYYWLNTVRFFDYPYDEEASAADGKYVVRGTFGESIFYTDPGYHRTRFSLDTSAVYLHGFGFGNETRFEGLLFPYVGPYFENLSLYNAKNGDFDFSQKGFRNNVRLGGLVSLLQTNILSANFIVQYTAWQGEHFDDFRRGATVGLLLRSYPIKPLVLEWKFGYQFFPHDFQIFESDLHVGIMINRYEIFASWKALDFSNEDTKTHFQTFYGASLGARVYFGL